MDGLKIIHKDGEWIPPDMAWVTGIAATVKHESQDRALQHGVILTGDFKVDSRSPELHFYILASSEDEYTAMRDEYLGHLYSEDMRICIFDRSIELSCIDSIKEEFFSGYLRRRSEVTVTFVSADPFWYASEDKSASLKVTASPATLKVENIGKIDTPPIITITATGAMPYIKITNSANGRMCIYQDPQFIAGQVLTINTATATVERSGTNTINAFSGTFHQLQRGANVFTVECNPACTVKISYTPRWL